MRVLKRVLACALAVMLVLPSVSVSAEELNGETVPVSIVNETKTEETAGTDVTEETETEETAGTDVTEETEIEGTEDADVTEDENAEGTEDADVTEDKKTEGTEDEDVTEEKKTEETAGEEVTEEKKTEETADTDVTEETKTEKTDDADVIEEDVQPEVDEVLFNTGNHAYSVVNKEAFDELEVGDVYFEEDGSYTINLEDNAFFPYEIQFTHEGEVTNEWFMTPDDSVEVGGHTFYVSSAYDGTALTQLSLEVGGETIVVYPEEKEFTDEAETGISPMSLIPLRTVNLGTVDLSKLMPIELTMVEVQGVIHKADENGNVAIDKNTQIAWKLYNDLGDDYTLSGVNDRINLSRSSEYGTTWEMIVGDGDQLNPNNIRYKITVEGPSMKDWIIPSAYTEDASGNRTVLELLNTYYGNSISRDSVGKTIEGRSINAYVSSMEVKNKEIYTGFQIKNGSFGESKVQSIRVVEGWYDSAEEAAAALASSEITDQVLADMTKAQAGYPMEIYDTAEFTMIAYDKAGNIVGYLPVDWYLGQEGSDVWVSLYQKTDTSSVKLGSTYGVSGTGYGVEFKLEDAYALDGNYTLVLDYSKEKEEYPDITAVYVGRYSTIAEAKAAGAVDITKKVVGDVSAVEGYTADFSKGIWFTVFAGADGDEEQSVYSFQAVTERYKPSLSSDTDITFTDLIGEDGRSVDFYQMRETDDSYAEKNYITLLVKSEENINQEFALDFDVTEGKTVYTEGSSSPEVPKVSRHSFANGPVQYTVSAENKENAKNYWVQIKNAPSEYGSLYISSLEDPDAKTTVKDGVTYSTREVMLDAYHDYIHDICLVNIGSADLPKLSAEISSDVVELDPYWTLSGNQSLKGLGTVDEPTSGFDEEGELPNLAKLRLRAKDGVADGTEVSGTLTIKSDGKPIMVLTLTGMVGNPKITTTEIPAAVKYVPYGTMIQNSNKYSWIDVSYSMSGGRLPAGMELKPNGELYGVPQETGTFQFGVRAKFTSTAEAYDFPKSYVTLTLVVNENTNANVYNETDAGYTLSTPIGVETTPGSYDFYLAEIADSLFVSEGTFNEFIDLWLNGQKLVKGVDYTAESGSTRITISAQTLQNKAAQSGNNTIAAEFRVDGDINKDLRRTAQNFRLDNAGSGNSGGGSSSGGSGSSSAARGVTISGYLVDANNAPLSGMTVELHSTPRTTVTDADGFFQFRDVEFGWHNLYVKDGNGNLLASRGFELREDRAVTLSGDVVTAPAGSGISLTIRLADGQLAFSNARLLMAPQTGDTSNPAIWLSVLALSCIAVAGIVIYRKKTRHFEAR